MFDPIELIHRLPHSSNSGILQTTGSLRKYITCALTDEETWIIHVLVKIAATLY